MTYRKLVLLLSFFPVLVFGAFSAQTEVKKTKVAEWISNLGSDDFETREAASRALRALGAKAVEALRPALKSTDAEVKSRALALFKSAIRPQLRLKDLSLVTVTITQPFLLDVDLLEPVDDLEAVTMTFQEAKPIPFEKKNENAPWCIFWGNKEWKESFAFKPNESIEYQVFNEVFLVWGIHNSAYESSPVGAPPNLQCMEGMTIKELEATLGHGTIADGTLKPGLALENYR